ncbi:MAG: glycosyltransferase family 39 protein [Acidobacteriota bacterium]|nr:MAG: glycosyltransferase family 39 protein [Acidobacteriota bacterium]
MSGETENQNNSAVPGVPNFVWYAFGIAVVIFYFFGLGVPLLGPDEPRYAQVAREMWQTGDWITTTLGGFHWFEKPALLYWSQIAAFSIFGVSEWAARLGPALFGLGTIASIWLIGRTEETVTGRKQLAFFATLIAATTLGIVVFARGASFDITVTFPITASLACFYAYDRGGKKSGLVGFYFFIGVALLAKGLIGIVFPFAIVGAYFVLSWRWPSRGLLLSLFWGSFLAAAVAATWYLPMYMLHGWEFIDEFFVQHHFARFTSNKYQHPQPFHFYFWVLPLMTIPWMPVFFAGLWKAPKAIFRRRDAETQEANSGNSNTPDLLASSSPLLLFSLSWLAVPLFFFSFSGSKLPGYILPAVPATVLMTSLYTYGKAAESPQWRNAILGLAGSTLVVVFLIVAFALPKFADHDSVRSLITAAAERGHTSELVVGFDTLQHNAEFYAAGRLLRTEDGRQRRFDKDTEIAQYLEDSQTGQILIIAPLKRTETLINSEVITGELLGDNTRYGIFLVRRR